MTLRHCDSFDHYGTANILWKWLSNVGGTITEGGRYQKCLQFPNTGGTVSQCLLYAVPTCYVGVGVRFSGLPTTPRDFIGLLDAGAEANQIQVTLALNPDGTIAIYRGGSGVGGVLLATSTRPMSSGIWYYVELGVTIANAGSYQVRVDDSAVGWIPGASGDTQRTANASVGFIQLYGIGVDGVETSFDDLYICDLGGESNKDFLGVVQVQSLFPIANGATIEWSLYAGGSNSAAVADIVPNGYSTAIRAAVPPKLDTYRFSAFSGDVGVIRGVQVCVARSCVTGYVRKLSAVVRSGGVDHFGPGIDEPGAQGWHYLVLLNTHSLPIWEVDPATNERWTSDGLGNAEFGVVKRVNGSSGPADWTYVTQVVVEVITGAGTGNGGEEPPPEIPNAAVVGIVREPSWAATPVYGDDPNRAIDGILFFPCKQENIQEGIGVLPQVDEFTGRRQLFRIPTSPGVVAGSLEFHTGADLLGYFLTAMFGTPDTDELHDSSGTTEAVYQHTWSPGELLRTQWPVPYTIESQYTAQPQYASSRSKLLQGAVLHDLELDVPNNAPMIVRGHFAGKRIVWLYPDEDDAHGSGTLDDRGVIRPARMSTIDPTVEEDIWHWSHVAAYPLIDGLPETLLTSLSLRPHFSNFAAGFTGGSGSETGTYRADTFVLSGRATILFADETTWLKFVRGLNFSLQVTLSASAIQADHSRELVINAYNCKMDGTQVVNRVGNVEYDFGWTARVDPTEGKACDFVLTNTVSTYAL